MLRLPLREYHWACPADLSAMTRGYELTHRDEWERVLIIANGTGGYKKHLTYEKMFGAVAPADDAVRTREQWEALKARMDRRKEQKQGVSDG